MNRTFILDLWDSIAGRGRGLMKSDRGQPLARSANLEQLGLALISGRGEASGVKLAGEVLSAYDSASRAQRLDFLSALANRFGPEETRLNAAVQAYLADKSQKTMADLSAASEPRRQELLRRINHAPGGTASLVRLREDLLSYLPDNPQLGVLDSDFVHLFSSWFNRGFLVLRRIDWTTPANILAKIIRYEAVHTIQSWDDLRNRLEPPDRKCFAFFHPQMADEPLVFVEVALTRDIPDAIAPLLDLDRQTIQAEDATTAVFYSISNCQIGLKGVSFGNFLIKQVVEVLKAELPGLKTFVTLSPVPGFTQWLKRDLAQGEASCIAAEDRGLLMAMLADPGTVLAEATPALRAAQMSAAAAYFLTARGSSGKPVDPVARFHLGNGARLERINFRGDVSANGLRQSCGLMVNYLYNLDAIEANHEAYANHRNVTASAAVQGLLKKPEAAVATTAKKNKAATGTRT